MTDDKRIADLEATVRFYKDREDHFMRVLNVCDGGRYRNDWNVSIERVVKERDAALARIAGLEAKVRELEEEKEDARLERMAAADWADATND